MYINKLTLIHYFFYSNNSFTGTSMADSPHNLKLIINTLKTMLLTKK